MKRLFIITCFFFFYFPAFSIVLDAYIVHLDGDTIHGQLHLSELSIYFHEDEIVRSKSIRFGVNGQVRKYSAKELAGYGVYFKEKWRAYWRVKVKGLKYRFAKRVIEGKISYYTFITFGGNSIMNLPPSFITHCIFEKAGTKERAYIRYGLGEISHRVRLHRMVRDCEAVDERIREDRVPFDKPEHWEKVARLYNDRC